MKLIGRKLSDFIQRESDNADDFDYGYNFNVYDIIEVPDGYWIIINNAPAPTSWAIFYYRIRGDVTEEVQEELYVIAEADLDLEWELVV